MKNDIFFMRDAISLAERATGFTSPNPLVGCVIVKGGRVIGRGYHKKAGTPHAEIHALRSAGKRSKGATLYVTLEPCDHFGRTPPCTDAVIKAGIKSVVIGMKDPNPVNNGRGMRRLKAHGISIRLGVLAKECASINRPYLKWITSGLPYVTIKIAESLDGKIATSTGESRWISSGTSREYVQKMRAGADAVMTGINTVLKDDPLLIPRGDFKKYPVRIVVDSALKIPVGSKLVKNVDKAPLWIAASKGASAKRKLALQDRGVKVIGLGAKKGRVDLKELLSFLGKNMLTSILVEGGAELAGSLFDGHLADEAVFFIAPKIIGGRGAVTSVRGEGVRHIDGAYRIKDMTTRLSGGDIVAEGRVEYKK